MSSQFCQACNRMGWLKTKRRGRQSCHYLRGPLCLGMQTSDQHLMYVETVICRCGNLELSPPPNSPSCWGSYGNTKGWSIPTCYPGEVEWVTACRCLCTHWRGHPECQFNLDTSYYRDGIRWHQSSPCDSLYQISQQRLWPALLVSEGRSKTFVLRKAPTCPCLGQKCTTCMKIRLEPFKSNCFPLILDITVFCTSNLFLNFMALFKVYLLW